MHLVIIFYLKTRSMLLCNLLLIKIRGDIVKKLVLIQLKLGSILFNEGDPGSFFYILKDGKLEFLIDGKVVTTFKPGDTFGELALIQKNKRTGTVKCIETAQIYCLDGHIFRKIVKKINQRNFKERLFFLSLIPIFIGLSNIKMHNIALAMLKCDFEVGQTIIRGKKNYKINFL
jgi:CRP-like cAMP-binding protein